MVFLPAIFVNDGLDFPTPWAQRPNSLARDVIHVSLSGPRNSLKFAVNQAKYKINKSNMVKGIRLELTFTFSAIGICAPLFVTVTGLNDTIYIARRTSYFE